MQIMRRRPNGYDIAESLDRTAAHLPLKSLSQSFGKGQLCERALRSVFARDCSLWNCGKGVKVGIIAFLAFSSNQGSQLTVLLLGIQRGLNGDYQPRIPASCPRPVLAEGLPLRAAY